MDFNSRIAAVCATSILLACAPCAFARQATPQIPAETPKEQVKELRTEAELRAEKLAAELSSMKAEIERMRVEYELALQTQTRSLQQANLEKARLEADLALLSTKETSESAPERAKIADLQRAQQLRDAQFAAELAESNTQQARLVHTMSIADGQLQAELAASRAGLERMRVAEDVLDMKVKTQIAAMKREQDQLAAVNALAAEKRRADQSRLADEQLRATATAQTASAQIQVRDLEEKWRDAINAPVQYTSEPFKDGVLTISDRKIDLNGPIMSGSAEYVCDRIDFFNNQDRTRPIFVVIDNSPGGSVMQGYRILKAIETSDAPVHVVVKSFAASMAATIATLAPHSYAYPNAIILHHQMSSSASGNMTDIEQEVKMIKEWERRLADPIAKKMGISLEEFRAKMYSARKSGDWDEFADKAVELKWVDHLVNEIREEGVRKRPTGSSNGGFWMSSVKHDDKGVPYITLPPLEPYDCYFMINPRGLYRVDGR